MKMRRTVLVLLAAVLAYPAVAGGQPAGASASDTATYHFLLGRYYESTGEVEKAIAAHKQALALEPASAEIRAELAGLYARQDRPADVLDRGLPGRAGDADRRAAELPPPFAREGL